MGNGFIQLARMDLYERVELSVIWRDGGGLEYWLRTKQGEMMQVSSQDALALSNLMAQGRWNAGQ